MYKDKIIYKDLSYKINGILFKVHNEFGRYANEKQVCDYIEEQIKQNKLNYEREKVLKPSFAGELSGRNRVDFIIEDTIILEIKTKERIERSDFSQITRYLESANKKLGLLVNYKDRYLKIHRVLNPHSNELTNSNIGKYESFVNSSNMNIKIKRLHPDTKMPNYAHAGDVGLDLYSVEDNYEMKPMERKVFNVGFALEFDSGYAAIIKDKGGPPFKHGLHTMGGVFDAGFRGEYNVLLANLGEDLVTVEKGQKIAQLIIYPVVIAELEQVEELSDSSRGDGKLGSTGLF